MATGETKTAVHLMNRENIIDGKKKEIPLTKLTKRPALGDVGNKIINRAVTKNADQKSLINIQKPTWKAPFPKPTSNTTVPKPTSNTTVPKPTSNTSIAKPTSTVTIPKITRQVPPKYTKREESTLDILVAFSEKQLKIYDPDENTKKDPNAVTEYLQDIFAYMREMEREYATEKDFLKNHSTTPQMRAILLDWIVEIQISFKLCIETLHLCVSLIDRFLQVNKKIGRDTLQLVGVSALLIASKYEEVMIPQVSEFVYVCDEAFTSKHILAMERDILAGLKFVIGRPTSIHFLRRYSKIGKVTAQQHNLGKYLLELAFMDHSLSHILPSHQAAAACCLAIGILNDHMNFTEVWSPTLIHYTTYRLCDFKHVCILIASLLFKVEKSKHQAVVKKYAASSVGKISTHIKLRVPNIERILRHLDPKH